VSVIGNAVADRNAALLRAVAAGDLAEARAIHTGLIPIMDAIMRTSQGAIQAKVALHQMGVIPTAAVRRPLVEGPVEDVARITAVLPNLMGELAVA
jgi:4-hydroxy-tetrahydrodipicolinate synthase